VQPGPPSLPLIDGKYQLVKQLGEGGMGAVYEARHRGTGRRVAVKVIAAASLARNPEIVARFQREAMASGAIESQYIAQVFDTGVDPATGSPYTVMELLSGEDLQQAIVRLGALPPELALRITAQACLGLRKAHESQVVHRDIKPANLFLARREDGDVVVKLLDFGIAKVKQDQLAVSENAGLTRTGAMLGSPLYMSPEQARGKKDIDHRTDIWSLGIVLYEALSGTTPHGHLDTIGELILQICSAPPRHLQELAPWVPPQVAGVVHRALALDPAARFASAAEMFDAIRALLPSGHATTEAMFTPVSPHDRAVTAPKLALTTGMRAPAPVSGGGVLPLGDTAAAPSGGTMNGVANARTGERPRRTRTVVLVPIALAMAGVGALLAVRIAGPHRTSSPPPPATAAPAAAIVAPADSTALVPLPAAGVDRTVRVVVLPADARAQVDGIDAPVQGGLLSITGSLGSVHHVRLTAGRREAAADVRIAEEGPVPPKVEVEMQQGRGAAPAAPPRPVTPPAAAPGPASPAATSTGGMHMEMK
jgi:serine/threonine-protein kinase